MIHLDVVVDWEGWDEAAIAPLAERAATAAFGAAGARGPASATLLLTDDRAVQELNRRWRGQDKPTNVLSFPAAAPAGRGGPRELGDIALAFETVRAEAERDGRSLADHAAHLVVHGILHLLGHDHESDREADAMERLETQILAGLGIADPHREPVA